MLIRDSSDSNPCFYIVTCAGESQSGLHIENWESGETTWYRYSAYLLQLYFAELTPETREISKMIIILLVHRHYNDATAV